MKKEYRSLPELAREQILCMLEDHRLGPGDAVSHRMLADELGMSTLSISSAFKTLEADGLIVTRNRSGSNIAVITPAAVWDLIQYRLAIELHGARLACYSATDKELTALAALAPAADGIGVHSELERVEADDRFHHALRQCAHTPSLLFPENYLRIFRLKLDMCAGLQIRPELLEDISRFTAHGHALIAEIAATRSAEQLAETLEFHICGLIGLPQLEELRRNSGKHLRRMDSFLSAQNDKTIRS
jgi:DNA-binding GntR family transcriptional regulator